MAIDVLLGLQWGDEGKGKVVDALSGDYDIIARFQGGPNSGHTVYVGGQKFVLHHIPSGVFHAHTTCIIGAGAVIDPITLRKETDILTQAGVAFQERLIVSQRAHLILPSHRRLDALRELRLSDAKVGTTLRGIGPCYEDKAARVGLRWGDIYAPDFEVRFRALRDLHLERLKIAVTETETEDRLFLETVKWAKDTFLRIDAEPYLWDAMDSNKRILAEGAQGALLDLEFGAYPYVTSSNTVAGGVCCGLGVPPKAIGRVIGVTKAYATRVGNGPFPTEYFDSVGDFIRRAGNEFGSTTGRPRRCGRLDLPALRFATKLSGVDELIVTKLDVLSGLENVEAAVAYRYGTEETEFPAYEGVPEPVYQTYEGWPLIQDDLPEQARTFLKDVAQKTGVPIKYICWGAERPLVLFEG